MTDNEKRLQEAVQALVALGLRGRATNKLAGYVLLALLGLKPNSSWKDCSNPLLGVTPVISYLESHFGVHYAPNTRESVRDEAIKHFVESNIVEKNPDDPLRSPSSAKNAYQVTLPALELFRTFGTPQWETSLADFRSRFPLNREDFDALSSDGLSVTVAPTSGDRNTEDEGGEKDDIGLGAFPIDSLMIRNETRTVFEVCRRVDAGKFILNPDFQRSYVWDIHKQSKLIESCLLRIPLPVFYLAEAADGKIIVVDGLQRLTTFHRYLRGHFKLNGLAYPDVNGCAFDDLPPTLQTRIEDMPLTLYLIDSKVPEEARYEIFERVNGGVPLTRQQMRNCIYTGKATRWLREMADSEEFLAATGNGLSRATMRDRECINRFAAFYLFGYESYGGKMDLFLGDALRVMNSSENLSSLTTAFLTTMRNNHFLFGTNAFRRSIRNDTKRSIINVALFDVMTLELAKLSAEDIAMRGSAIVGVVQRLLVNSEFVESISRSTNSARNVQRRFALYETWLAWEELDD